MSCIFISYRRRDSSGYAGRIYDHLVAHFGKARVFMDVSGIGPGEDFAHVISSRLSSCSAFLPIIGEQWLRATDEGGVPRLTRDDDLVRMEIDNALRSGVRIIPVLVGGASMPRAADLPAEMRSLSSLNAMSVTHETFDEGMIRLIRVLGGAERPHPRWLESLSLRVQFLCLMVAGVATLFTRYLFDSMRVTADAPFGAAETVFVFLVYLTVIACAVWLLARRRKQRASG